MNPETTDASRVQDTAKDRPFEPNGRPLVADLDGTLLRSDILIETAVSVGWNAQILRALITSKAALKHALAAKADIDPAVLPYDDAVVARIRAAKASGRQVYLASASNERIVAAIAKYLGCFDGWFASNETTNLKGKAKARQLVQRFGERGFDYIGDDAADLAVWSHAANVIAVRASKKLARRLALEHPNAEHLVSATPNWRDWLKLVRVHQYAKNTLVFLPLLTAHAFSVNSIVLACLAALAFSVCASGVYIINDMSDLSADRAHPTKKCRPLAAGVISLRSALIAAAFMFVLAAAIAITISRHFAIVLFGYLALTTVYSVWLKRKLIVDVVVLAMLYIARIIGGAVAIEVNISEWLLAFSLLVFTCLALIKRYIELATLRDANLSAPSKRNYWLGDMDIIAALAAAAGFNAITVFCLYISSDTVRHLYRYPQVLWLITPVLMYWLCRLLVMAHRSQVHEDPIVFAFHDRISLLTTVTIIAIVLIAI
jgi:4-hydroxybenzoate polyprenyltransferase/phosphoserine phosphatase